MRKFLSDRKIIVILMFVLAGLAGWTWKVAYRRGLVAGRSNIQSFERRLSELDLELGRAQTHLVESGDALARMHQLNSELRERLASTGAELVVLGEAHASLKTTARGRLARKPKTVTREVVREVPVVEMVVGSCPSCEDPSCEWGYSDFRLDVFMDVCHEKFQYQLTQRFRVLITELIERNGDISSFLKIHELDLDGKEVAELSLDSFEVDRVRRVPEEAFHWWAPHLDIGLALLSSYSLEPSSAASIGLSVGGFGRTEDDHLWRWGRIALNLGKTDAGIGLSPFGFNIGKGLPLVSDVWVWPIWAYDGVNSFGIVVGTTF